MVPSDLPEPPDFVALDRAADVPKSNGAPADILAMIGQLTYMWSNNESLLIYVIMLLLGTDAPSAAVVFATLNTTRARLTLVERLAKINIRDRALARDLSGLLRRFRDATRVRNDFNHCLFHVDRAGRITHTQSTRIEEDHGEIQFGQVRAVDAARIEEVRQAIGDLGRLNRDLWRFLPRLRDHLATEATRRRPPPRGEGEGT